MSRPVRILIALAAVAVLAAGCGDDGASTRGSASASGSGSGSGVREPVCEVQGDPSQADATVAVTLDDFTIGTDPGTVDAGTVTFDLDDVGRDPHEFLVVRADSASDLPTGDDGAVVEEEIDADVLVGEVSPFPAGETCQGTFELSAGSYVLFCNIVETEQDGTVESHFAKGMATTFTVG